MIQSGDQIKLWCYFPAESQSAITIYLGQGGFAQYVAKTLSGKDMVGWWCFMVRKEEFSLFGSVDWQQPFDTIRIRLDSSKPHDRVHLDGLYISSHDPPQVVVTFDDGSASDYSIAYKVMKEYGLVGTSFIVTDFVGRNTNLSLAEMTEMYASGWDFANHTKSHKDLTLLDTPHMVEEIVSAKQWLLAHGFTRAADYFAFPYGRFGGTSDALRHAGVVAARTTINSLVETASGRPDRLRIPVALGLSPSVTCDMARSTVDDAVARGQSLVIYGHALTSGTPGAYEWQANDFRELVRYIAQKRDEGKLIVKTFRDWSSGL
ncbi:hypothetical protein RW64_16680 [Geobacter sulfurreducens]|nr:hypothetical protein RW64_16680 [Geobacter sulfurreducens]